MTDTNKGNGWPPRPAEWPEVMTDVELCQFLRLDETHEDPASAKRALRYIRRTTGLLDAGRIAGRVLFRKATVDTWLAAREGGDQGTAGPQVMRAGVVS
jgi:hypothetical protein